MKQNEIKLHYFLWNHLEIFTTLIEIIWPRISNTAKIPLLSSG